MTVAELTGPQGRELTAEQALAVGERDGDLLLSAAAGSGKTSVLVERFVRHVVEDGIAPGRILAITFTDKAAGELRRRIRARLLELGERDAARDAEAAWIGTVHGFCARLLRGHAVSAGLDPAFAILDEPVSRDLRATAWERALAAWLDAGGDPALDLAAAFGADGLRGAIEDVHAVLRSAGETSPRLPVPAPAPLPDPAALRRLRDAAAAALAGAGDGRSIEAARRALDRCGEMLAGLEGDELPDRAMLDGARFAAGNTRLLGCPPCSEYLVALEAYAEACARHRGTAAVARLGDLLARYVAEYRGAKRARSGLDFDDLELLARDLLAGSPGISRATRERFDRVMVDEFQDSNARQVELFGLVADGNLFTVGDELQSIYGFRHADVEVFRHRRAELEAIGRTARLTVNFRSHPEILAAVNVAFGERFGAGFTPLRPGVEPSASAPAGGATAGPRVELLLTGTEGWDEVDLGELPRAARWRHAEARLIAQRVRDLVDAGEAAPEDVVVLLRAVGDLPAYERALEDQGLQTLAAGGRGYWGRQVVRDLCAWLAALANPRDEKQLYGVLASPLVGLSSDALALVAQHANPGGAWRAIEDERADARLALADRERLAAFRTRFAAERALAPRLALDELLRRAVEVSDYDLHVLRLPGGARRLANIHKLLRLAAEHERSHGRDVRGLVDRAVAELEAEARETDAPVELGDARAVRLMTIHAAKGLEFPVVVVGDLGRRRPDSSPALLVGDGRLGVRLSGLDGGREYALDYEPLRDRRREAETAEADRVVYVALTRAERRLVLSGGADLGAWPRESHQSPPITWLAPALLGGVDAIPGEEEPDLVVEHGDARVRCAVSTPATVGRVLRTASLAPAGTDLPAAPPPPARGPLPAPPAPQPAVRSLSYSALQQWRRCAYRFYLQRVLRLPEEPLPFTAGRRGDGGLDARVRGTLVHEALEQGGAAGSRAETAGAGGGGAGTTGAGGRGAESAGAGGGGAGTERAEAALAAAAARQGVEPTAAELAGMAALVTGFGRSPLAARIAAAEHVHREHPFSFPLGGALLTGVVDVLATGPDGEALVVDYKTDAVAPGEDLGALVDRDYGVQRLAYALAALRGGAPSVEVAYAFLERPGEPVVARFAAADADALAAELEGLAAGALGGSFPVAAEPHLDLCAGCPGRRALCIHPEELTGRELPAASGA